MNTAPTPEPRYWDEVRHCNEQLYGQSLKRSTIPGVTLADVRWEDPQSPNKLTYWHGVWLAGSLCVRANLITIDGESVRLDGGGHKSVSLAQHFRYRPRPFLEPKLTIHSHIYQVRSDDPDSVDKAIAQGRASEVRQNRLGLAELQPADYEFYLEELRRGASGEFTVLPLESE